MSINHSNSVEIVFGTSAFLNEILNTIEDITDTCNFKCTEEGIKIQALDGFRTVLVQIFLGDAVFERYNSNIDLCLGINCKALKKVIKLCSPEDSIALKADQHSDVLSITSSNSGNVVFFLRVF